MIEIDLRSIGIKNVQSYLENIIALMPGHVYWLDINGAYLGCNDQQAKVAGLSSRKQIVGKRNKDLPWNCYTGAKPEAIDATNLEIIRSGIPQTVEEPGILQDGSKAIFLSSKAPLRDESGEIIGLLGISIDITKQKEIERKLIEAKEEAEAANRTKTEFIRNMEHDIRTPFNGIFGIANYLAERETDLKKKEFLSDIANCAKELLDYCNDVLDFSKIEQHSLPLLCKSFSIPKLIDSVITMETPPAMVKHLNLSASIAPDVPSVIKGDRYRLQRILINLLSNAIKFTNDGNVKLSVRLAKVISEREIILRFIVEDTGIGIPEEKQDVIYDSFTRITPSNQGAYKGKGLGLRIVKQFVEEMQGDIDVKSKPLAGSTFYCTFPFRLPLLNDLVEE
ncbi:MAG: ATP-binding protein [Gammaproteobacteria bacterium]